MKRTPIKKISDRRRVELAEYRKRRISFLAEHPICRIWLAENDWTEVAGPPGLPFQFASRGGRYETTDGLIEMGAPRSTEIHHRNKRRRSMLNNTSYWMAVCRENHQRIENDKQWARANGFLLNF